MAATRPLKWTLADVRLSSQSRARFLLLASALVVAGYGVDVLQGDGPNWSALSIRLAWSLILAGHALCLQRAGLRTIWTMTVVACVGTALLYLLLVRATGRADSPLVYFTFILAMILPLILPEMLVVGLCSAGVLVLGNLAILAAGGRTLGEMVGWVQAGVLAFATSGLLSAAFQRTQLSERLAAQARAEALAANEQLVEELREALANVKALSGMLPICAWCHKVRNDEGYWEQIEAYISARSEAEFSHALCPDCYARHFAER